MKKKLILGNWKMNGSLAANEMLIGQLRNWAGDATIGICPPSIYLGQVAQLLQGSQVSFGAQDCSIYANGAYTGENSAEMIADLGAKWCLIGHSERRQYHHESNEMVALKANAATKAGLTPVICIGESLKERESGQTEMIIEEQVRSIFRFGDAQTHQEMVIAYEPIWAIGTGLSASPEQAQSVHNTIRSLCCAHDQTLEGIHLLYGGSMNDENVGSLLEQADIDGGLIGGASLKGNAFLAIMQRACTV